jgi:hypothetical protein
VTLPPARRLVAAIVAITIIVAACGGDDEPDGGGAPIIANSPIATVTPDPTLLPVCDPAALPAPEGISDDVILPPDYLIESIETSPHLLLRGVVTPPESGAVPPYELVALAMRDNMIELGWTVRETRGAGKGYEFLKPDQRYGIFFARPLPDCEGRARFDIDFRWIVP